MDPRVKTSPADLQRQFEAASRLNAGIGELTAAVQRADDLRKQIAVRSKEAEGNSDVTAALAGLDQKVGELTGSAAGGGFGFFGFAVPGNEPVTLRQVSGAYGALLGIIESADAAPTVDASTASAKWEEAGKAALARMDAIQTKELTRVNSLLEKAHLQPLKFNR
jgi:hypothetical protein